MLESSHHRNGYWLRGQNIFISCSDITKTVHTCHSVWVTSFCECGRAGGAVYNQGRLCVLWDGLAQRSGRSVLLGKSLQTGCFDEPESITWMFFFSSHWTAEHEQQEERQTWYMRISMDFVTSLTWKRQPSSSRLNWWPRRVCDSEPVHTRF